MKRGTVVLTPFPFTDLSGQKVRPAERSIILGELGEFSDSLLHEVNEKLRHALGLEPQQEDESLPTAC